MKEIIADAGWVVKKVPPPKNTCFIDYIKAINCINHVAQWDVLRKMLTPEHLFVLMQILYAEQKSYSLVRKG